MRPICMRLFCMRLGPQTTIDRSSAQRHFSQPNQQKQVFARRALMSWQPEIDELKRRTAMAHELGGPESVAFHKGGGKLTVRERLDLLADAGSFRETGALAGRPEWDGNELKKLTPANAVTGVVEIDGRRTIVHGGDFTIRG